PVSKTGLMVYHPPMYRVAAEMGAFRADAYEAPSSTAFSAAPAISNAPQQVNANATQQLVDRYRARTVLRKAVDSGPVGVSFPAMGPNLFLVSELTAEGKAPVVELSYQREKKGGLK